MNKRFLAVAATAFGLVAPREVRAQDPCAIATPTSEQVNECADQRARGLDSLRIEVENVIERGLEFETLQEFQRARQLWRDFRDTECRFESRDAGAAALLVFLRCHAALSADRVERISDLVCDDGGVTGTCQPAEDFRAALRRLRVEQEPTRAAR